MSVTPIEVRIVDVVINDPTTLQLRFRASRGDTENLVSTVWTKEEASMVPGQQVQTAAVTLHSVMQERGDDTELAAAAERAAVKAIEVDGGLFDVELDGTPDLQHEAPDPPVVYYDRDENAHEL